MDIHLLLQLHLHHLQVVPSLLGLMTTTVMMKITMPLAIMMEEHAVTTKTLDGILTAPLVNV